MIKSNKKWCIAFICLTIMIIIITASTTMIVDPYFHYHKPLTNMFFYPLDNQRSQNNGIVKHFEYDAIITGTSMTENFKTSEMDILFDVNSIKTPFFGGSYKEMNDNLKIALKYNPNIKLIVRGLDGSMFFDDKDRMPYDLGEYPTYLYDNNPFNDVKYVLNKDVLLQLTLPKIKNSILNHQTGITDFDTYSNWNSQYTYGKDVVVSKYLKHPVREKQNSAILTTEEKERISQNVMQNIISLAKQYPNTKFYYFFPPYSIVWWSDINKYENINKQIEAEQYIIELILQCDNIYLFSFNNNFELVTNLDNYKDYTHYGEWINSYILECMKENKFLLTKNNYIEYIDQTKNFYNTYNYASLFEE